MVRYNRIFALMLAFVLALTMTGVSVPGVSAESVSHVQEIEAEYTSPDPSASLEFRIGADDDVLSGKLYCDTVNHVLAVVGSASHNGRTLEDLAVYLGEDGLVVSGTPSLDQPYGIDLRDLSKNLPGSVFAPGSDSQLALDRRIYNRLMGLMSSDHDELMSEALDALTPHLTTAFYSMLANTQSMSGPRTLELPSGEVKVRTQKEVFTAETIAEAYASVVNGIAADPEAQDALARLYDEMVSAGTITVEDDMQGVTGKELVEEKFRNAGEMIQSFTQLVTESGFCVSILSSMDQFSMEDLSMGQMPELRSLGFEFSANGESTGMEVIFTDDTFAAELTHNGARSNVTCWIQENTETKMTVAVSAESDVAEAVSYTMDWDKVSGKFEITSSNGGTWAGTVTSTDTDTTVTFEKINGEPWNDTCIKISTDDPITIPDYKEILTMTEEEILRVVQNVSNAV